MISNQIIRFIHTHNFLWQASGKGLLAKLRKKTGYTFSNCKKALEVNENDIEKAELWLKEQAQALGWSQAVKLQGRSTKQGLIAVIVEKTNAALIEINCETDFVARNKVFQGLAETVASAVLKYTTTLTANDMINRILLDSEALKALPALDGKLVADHSALAIGTVRENIGIRRALCMTVPDGVNLSGCTHPSPLNPVLTGLGRYGAVIAYKSANENKLFVDQLCQHIIGMNPLKIGQPGVDEPNTSLDDETTMIHQEFLLDPNITVHQALIDAQIEIVDFARFEMGETLEGSQNLDTVETCG